MRFITSSCGICFRGLAKRVGGLGAYRSTSSLAEYGLRIQPERPGFGCGRFRFGYTGLLAVGLMVL
jgi:hypothetical protein